MIVAMIFAHDTARSWHSQGMYVLKYEWQSLGESNPSFQVENLAS